MGCAVGREGGREGGVCSRQGGRSGESLGEEGRKWMRGKEWGGVGSCWEERGVNGIEGREVDGREGAGSGWEGMGGEGREGEG